MLTGLGVDDSDEMARVLNDEALYEFIGGRPPTPRELRDRYAELVAGPGTAGETWLNWIVRSKSDGVAMGTVQATISTTPGGQRAAEVSWVIGTRWQRRGFASEAARSLVDWLGAHGVDDVTAHIASCHRASETVARRIGLKPTGELHDGEIIWRNA